MKYLFLTLLTIILFNSCHQANALETRKVIAVIDTGVDHKLHNKAYMCQNGMTGIDATQDTNGHGTNIVDLIGSRIDSTKYCIHSVSTGAPGNKWSHGYSRALKEVSEMDIVGLNLSIASPNEKRLYLKSEAFYIKKILQKGAKVFVAAGNDGYGLEKDNCYVYPACLKYNFQDSNGQMVYKFFVVGSSTSKLEDVIPKKPKTHDDRHRLRYWLKKEFTGTKYSIKMNKKEFRIYSNYSNRGPHVDLWYDGTGQGIGNLTGTSQATAIATGEAFKH